MCLLYLSSERPLCPHSQNQADWSIRRPCRTWAAPNPASSLIIYQNQPLPARQQCRPIAELRWYQRTSIWQMIGWRMTWVMCSLRRNGEFLSTTSHAKQLPEIRIISQYLLKLHLEVCDIRHNHIHSLDSRWLWRIHNNAITIIHLY